MPLSPRAALAVLTALFLACGPGDALITATDDAHFGGPVEEGSYALNAGDVRVRLMAANISSGNYQSYDPGHGTRIFQGTDPDVVMIQEFNYGSNTTAELRGFVDTAFGPTFQYYREGGAQIPNGVISRYPILASGEWDDPRVSNRDFAWARIDIPGDVDLYAISVHLLTASATERNLEAQALVSFIQQHVPAGAYVAIGGDFNTSSRTEAALSTLGQVVVSSGPYPVDHAGNGNTNASRAKPYDWVLVSSGLQARRTSVDIGGSSFVNGAVIDTRVYSPLAEISPALSGDSAATNMQHMAVIRDFGLPSGTTSPTPAVTVTAPNGGESLVGGSTTAITWTSANVSTVRIEYSANGGTSWSVLTASTAASTGSYPWTVPASATTAGRVRVVDTVSGTGDASNAAFTITVDSGGGGSGVVFINEVLVNEAGSDPAGEFVEIVNDTDAAMSLAGWTVSDGAGLRHTFASGTSVPAGGAIVVFGGAAGVVPGTNGVAASSGALGLSNSGDSVTLKNAAGTVVDTVTLGSALCGTDGVSANRSPDATPDGGLALHTSLAAAQRSPGNRADGTAFGGTSGGGGGGTTTPSISTETESNNTAASANGPLGNNKNVSATISSTTDADWFKLTVKAGGAVTLKVTVPGSADLDWYLYSASNTSSYLARGYTTANPETGTYTAAAGEYYVKVVGYSGATSSYTLNVSAASGLIDP